MTEKRTIAAADFLRAIQQAEEYFDLPGVGTVKLRSLSTRDAQTAYQKYGDNRADLMAPVVSAGMIEPKLTEEQVAALYDSKAGPVTALFERIGEISAINPSEELSDLAGGGSSS